MTKGSATTEKVVCLLSLKSTSHVVASVPTINKTVTEKKYYTVSSMIHKLAVLVM